MASEKISAMPAATTIADADLLTIVQGGINKKVPWSVLVAAVKNIPLADFVDASDFAQFDSVSADGYTYVSGGKLVTDSGLVRAGAGNVQVAGQLQANILVAVAQLLLQFLPGNGVLKLDGAQSVDTDQDVVPSGTGTLQALVLAATNSISGPAGAFTVDGSGNMSALTVAVNGNLFTADSSGIVNAAELHAANGENFSAPITTATIVDGIVTEAT